MEKEQCQGGQEAPPLTAKWLEYSSVSSSSVVSASPPRKVRRVPSNKALITPLSALDCNTRRSSSSSLPPRRVIRQPSQRSHSLSTTTATAKVADDIASRWLEASKDAQVRPAQRGA